MLTVFMICVLLIILAVPSALHDYLPAIFIAISLAIIAFCLFRVRGGFARFVRDPNRPKCRWEKGVDVIAYQRFVTMFLRDRGWRVLASAVLDPARVDLTIQKDRRRAVLVFLAPGRVPTEQDVAQLTSSRSEADAQNAAMVGHWTDGHKDVLSAKDAQSFLLDYDDLNQLDSFFQTYANV
jgi:hypothetical protein